MLASVFGACSLLDDLSPRAVAACEARVDNGVLPEWARAGFTDPEPALPHVLGAQGDIVAILFGERLNAPPAADHTNKILWVAKRFEGAGDLLISAQRMDGTDDVGERVERRVDGGPGPSTIDLPEPGCWRLSLAWGHLTDRVDLGYADPRASDPPG
jgi:hypothetical protein